MNEMIVTLSYDGGGWTFPYLAGITKYLQDHPVTGVEFRYAGISAGSCVGLAAALGIPMDKFMQECLAWAPWCRWCPLLTVRAVRAICSNLVTTNSAATTLSSFAVNVSALSWPKLQSVVLSSFGSKAELVGRMGDTCSLPLLNTFSLGQQYYDGGLSTRFFTPPWRSDKVITLSACKLRRGATYTCSVKIPWWRSIVPYSDAGLKRLYDIGYRDGAQVAILCAD